MQSKARIALVVGGSGMLAGLCHELSRQYTTVGVIGRTVAKMQPLLVHKNVVPVYVDYTDVVAYETALRQFVSEYGRPSLVVAWIHSTSPEATVVTAGYCTGDFYEVTGRSGAEPGHVSRQHEKAIAELGVRYHRVILGQMGGRWLTDDEISSGTLEALSAKTREYVVGHL